LVSGGQLVEHLSLLQVERVETLSEPTMDRSEKILGLSCGFEGERHLQLEILPTASGDLPLVGNFKKGQIVVGSNLENARQGRGSNERDCRECAFAD